MNPAGHRRTYSRLSKLPTEILVQICKLLNESRHKINLAQAYPGTFLSATLNIIKLDPSLISNIERPNGSLDDNAPICYGVRENFVEVVADIVSVIKGDSLDLSISQGPSPPPQTLLVPIMSYAVEKGRPEIVDILLKEGVDPNLRYSRRSRRNTSFSKETDSIAWKFCDHVATHKQDWQIIKESKCVDSLEFALICMLGESNSATKQAIENICLRLIGGGAYQLPNGRDIHNKFSAAVAVGSLRLVKALWPLMESRLLDNNDTRAFIDQEIMQSFDDGEYSIAVMEYLLKVRSSLALVPDPHGDGLLIEQAVRKRHYHRAVRLLRVGLINQPVSFPEEERDKDDYEEAKIQKLLELPPEKMLETLLEYESIWSFIANHRFGSV